MFMGLLWCCCLMSRLLTWDLRRQCTTGLLVGEERFGSKNTKVKMTILLLRSAKPVVTRRLRLCSQMGGTFLKGHSQICTTSLYFNGLISARSKEYILPVMIYTRRMHIVFVSIASVMQQRTA